MQYLHQIRSALLLRFLYYLLLQILFVLDPSGFVANYTHYLVIQAKSFIQIQLI